MIKNIDQRVFHIIDKIYYTKLLQSNQNKLFLQKTQELNFEKNINELNGILHSLLYSINQNIDTNELFNQLVKIADLNIPIVTEILKKYNYQRNIDAAITKFIGGQNLQLEEHSLLECYIRQNTLDNDVEAIFDKCLNNIFNQKYEIDYELFKILFIKYRLQKFKNQNINVNNYWNSLYNQSLSVNESMIKDLFTGNNILAIINIFYILKKFKQNKLKFVNDDLYQENKELFIENLVAQYEAIECSLNYLHNIGIFLKDEIRYRDQQISLIRIIQENDNNYNNQEINTNVQYLNKYRNKKCC